MEIAAPQFAQVAVTDTDLVEWESELASEIFMKLSSLAYRTSRDTPSYCLMTLIWIWSLIHDLHSFCYRSIYYEVAIIYYSFRRI